MRQFSYVAAADVGSAVDLMTRTPGARYLAGGTNLVDLIREGVEQPVTLIDVTPLPLTGIEELAGGGLRIGALVRNSELAASPLRLAVAVPMSNAALRVGRAPASLVPS